MIPDYRISLQRRILLVLQSLFGVNVCLIEIPDCVPVFLPHLHLHLRILLVFDCSCRFHRCFSLHVEAGAVLLYHINYGEMKIRIELCGMLKTDVDLYRKCISNHRLDLNGNSNQEVWNQNKLRQLLRKFLFLSNLTN